MKVETKEKAKMYFLLHILMLIFSSSSICSKLAAQEAFLSVRFCMYYGMVLFILVIYAVCWQQILKKLPLVTAYANKAVTILWGLIWGRLFFGEQVTIQKIIGAIIIVGGIYLVVSEKEVA